MSDKFPKQYVLDRIAAREGSLTLKIDSDERLIEAWKKSKITNLDARFEKTRAEIHNAVATLKDVEKAYAKAQDFDQKKQALKALSPLSISDPARELYWETNSEKVPGDTRSLSAIQHSVAEMRKEMVALAHARIHLTEMPVTEFSLSSLKSLGLLSALKFDLAEAVAAQKKAS